MVATNEISLALLDAWQAFGDMNMERTTLCIHRCAGASGSPISGGSLSRGGESAGVEDNDDEAEMCDEMDGESEMRSCGLVG